MGAISDGSDSGEWAAIGRGPRWALGVIGVVLMSAGGVAVFLPGTNVAGVPLLILSGAAFLYVSATGQQLIQVNKDGVVFARLRRVEKVLSDITKDPGVSDDAKERIFDVAEENGVNLATRTAHQIESEIEGVLSELSQTHSFSVIKQRHDQAARIDFLLRRDRGGPDVPVEVRRTFRSVLLLQRLQRIKGLEIGQGLLVVGSPVSESTRAQARQGGVRIVVWDGSSRGKLELEAALRELQVL